MFSLLRFNELKCTETHVLKSILPNNDMAFHCIYERLFQDYKNSLIYSSDITRIFNYSEKYHFLILQL